LFLRHPDKVTEGGLASQSLPKFGVRFDDADDFEIGRLPIDRQFAGVGMTDANLSDLDGSFGPVLADQLSPSGERSHSSR
jgi:hypothetical protein